MSHRLSLNRLVLSGALCVVLGLLGILMLLPTAGARAQGSSGGGTVTICEATGNPNAPYVEVDVPQSDLGNYGAAEGDIIPAPPNGCPSKAKGTTGTTGPSGAPHKRHPKHTPQPTTPPASTPAPVAASPPPVVSTPLATRPAAVVPDENDVVPAASARALPATGGHTLVTIVLGLLLLYCGGVIRWAAAGPTTRGTQSPHS